MLDYENENQEAKDKGEADGSFAQEGKRTVSHPPSEPARFALTTSCQFSAWMAEQNVSLAYTTGDLDIHDVAVDPCGRPIFVNTLFSCLATVSERYSFAPLFISVAPAFD